MGAYNVLTANVKCANCNETYLGQIQFKYGDTWQLKYKIGDELKWGGNNIGAPHFKQVKVYGILESDICPICSQLNPNDEYDMYVNDNIIVGIEKMKDVLDFDASNYKPL